MKEFKLIASIENLEQVINFINKELDSNACPAKIKTQIDVVIDELFANIANYAYKEKDGEVIIKIDFEENPKCVEITFMDRGIPFNPLEREDPDITLSINERQIGGLGIFMVKKIMDEVTYDFKEGYNILKIKKNI